MTKGSAPARQAAPRSTGNTSQRGSAPKKTVRVGGPDSTAVAEVAVNPTGAAPEQKVDSAEAAAQREEVVEQAGVASDVVSPTEALKIVGSASSVPEDASKQADPGTQAEGPDGTGPVQAADAQEGNLSNEAVTAAAGVPTANPPTDGEVAAGGAGEPVQEEEMTAAPAENANAAATAQEQEIIRQKQRQEIFQSAPTNDDVVRRLRVIISQEKSIDSTSDEAAKLAREELYTHQRDSLLKATDEEIPQEVQQNSLYREGLAQAQRANPTGSATEMRDEALLNYFRSRDEIQRNLLTEDGQVKDKRAVLSSIEERIRNQATEAGIKSLDGNAVKAQVLAEYVDLVSGAYVDSPAIPLQILQDTRYDYLYRGVLRQQSEFAARAGIDTNNPRFIQGVTKEALEQYLLEKEKDTLMQTILEILKKFALYSGVVLVAEVDKQLQDVTAGK